MRQGYTGKDEVLVDPKIVTADPTTSVHYLGISDDGSLIAYGIRKGGEDESVRSLLIDVDDAQAAVRRAAARALHRLLHQARQERLLLLALRRRQRLARLLPRHGIAELGRQEIFGKGYGPTQMIELRLSGERPLAGAAVADGVPAKKNEIYVQDVGQGPHPDRREDTKPSSIPTSRATALFLTTNWKAPNRRIFRVDLQEPGARALEGSRARRHARHRTRLGGRRTPVRQLPRQRGDARQAVRLDGKALGD